MGKCADTLKANKPVKDAEAYSGPVCWGQDGWHYTVVPDEETEAMAIASAETVLNFEKSRKFGGSDERIANAEAALLDAKQRTYDRPGERLYHDGFGGYRIAKDGDPSHHEQFHEQYVDLVPDTEDLTDQQKEALLAMANRIRGAS